MNSKGVNIRHEQMVDLNNEFTSVLEFLNCASDSKKGVSNTTFQNQGCVALQIYSCADYELGKSIEGMRELTEFTRKYFEDLACTVQDTDKQLAISHGEE